MIIYNEALTVDFKTKTRKIGKAPLLLFESFPPSLYALPLHFR